MRGILIAVIVSMAGTSALAADAGWKSEFGLYGWLSGLEGTIGVADIAEEPIDATFDDLAGYVDFAMAGHFETRNASTVLIADVSYTGLGAERDATVANQPVTVDGDLQQWIVELGGGYRVSPALTLLVVGRYYNLDTGATFNIDGQEQAGGVSTGWADIYVGGQYAHRFGSRWVASLRADVGMGGSDFAWFGQALLGFDLSERFTVVAAYRLLSLDREADVNTADYFKYDVTQSGLGLGLAYGF